MIEIAGIIILGIVAQWMAWKIKVPAILPLIVFGLIFGPLSTLWNDGVKWIEPTWQNNNGLFPGETLFYFVELAIGIILFEGGLTLKRNEIRGVGPSILKLISLGSFITFIGAALGAHYLIQLNWSLSFLFSSLIIVTGPTVIAPILRNIPLKTKVAAVLKWEGILIDPIGALVAVLAFEFISTFESGSTGLNFTEHAFKQFMTILLVGSAIGFISAHGLREILKRSWVPHYLLNVFTLAFVLTVFVSSEYFVHDSGLLTLVMLGMILGNIEVPHLKEILDFKESISILLISILFILLSANINISELKLVINWQCLFLFLFVVFVLRPLSVFSSTTSSNLNIREKVFISWVGPRGIVAAGIASLFGLKLMKQGFPQAEYITPLVFMIVLGTVLLNATTARLIGRLLKVVLTKSNAIVFVGSNTASRLIAQFLIIKGKKVVIVDNNPNNVENAIEMGIPSFQANIYNDDISDHPELSDVGYLLAMTSSIDVNNVAIQNLGEHLGEHGSYRLLSADEIKQNSDFPEIGLFAEDADFINLNEIARDFPSIHEIEIGESDQLESLLQIMHKSNHRIPLMIEAPSNSIQFMILGEDLSQIEAGSKLYYLGEVLSNEV